MMVHLSQTPPNMISIGAVCDSLEKAFLTLLVSNLGATGGLGVNSSLVKEELRIFPLFLPEGNAILPMTAKAVCGPIMHFWCIYFFFINVVHLSNIVYYMNGSNIFRLGAAIYSQGWKRVTPLLTYLMNIILFLFLAVATVHFNFKI